MVLIERGGWEFRRRDRGKGKGLAGGVLNGRWTVFFWRHGEHTSSDVAIAPGCLHKVAGPVWFVSVSHKSPETHLGVEGNDPSEGQAVFKCTRTPAGRGVQSDETCQL